MSASAEDRPVGPAASTGTARDRYRNAFGALVRFRVVAYVVGVGLIVLVFVGVPLKYLADQRTVVAVVGPLHGALYVVYLLLALDLAVRCRWQLLRTVAVMLAGTVPFLSFVAERKATGWVRAEDPARRGRDEGRAPRA